MGSLRFELKTSAMSRLITIEENTLNEYLDTIELSGITLGHKKEVKRFLERYLDYIEYNIDKAKSISYFKHLKDNNSISYYRKQSYQILKFLKFIKVDWIDEIKLPPEPTYYPKYISKDMVNSALKYFETDVYYPRFKAIISLGIDSGMRAGELYQLTPEDIDLQNRIVRINHNPNNGQSTKTKKSRISFYTKDTRKTLSEYLDFFNKNDNLTRLFPQRWLEGNFRKTDIRVKHLRKFFSQEWDRRGGATSIKKILMGHSLKGDVDLMHYNAQSEEDLKMIYDKVMGGG
jgi:integrase/recombinase XerD